MCFKLWNVEAKLFQIDFVLPCLVISLSLCFENEAFDITSFTYHFRMMTVPHFSYFTFLNWPIDLNVSSNENSEKIFFSRLKCWRVRNVAIFCDFLVIVITSVSVCVFVWTECIQLTTMKRWSCVHSFQLVLMTTKREDTCSTRVFLIECQTYKRIDSGLIK